MPVPIRFDFFEPYPTPSLDYFFRIIMSVIAFLQPMLQGFAFWDEWETSNAEILLMIAGMNISYVESQDADLRGRITGWGMRSFKYAIFF